ncbi:MAG: sodium:solute symporter family protein [Phycisphaerae bacterium]|nr:sodium:solute symporter family protein [Phycisphaerae bacterium]
MFSTRFTSLDWWIVAVYLVGTGLLGVFANRYIHSVSDYMVGGRGSRTALNTATRISTGLGLVTIMYAAMDGFQKGFSYMTLGLIGVAVLAVLGSTGFVVVRLRQMSLTTIPEYFERRYGKTVRVTAGAICAGAGILNMGLFPRMGATFITYATGMGGEDHVLTVNIVTSLMIALVLLYTVLGGMVSVIITDYVQFVILSVGLGVGLYFCLTGPDLGWHRMVASLSEHRGEGAFNPFHANSYGWVWVVWMAIHVLAASVCWAPEASRALTARNPKTAKRTFLFSTPGQFVRVAIPALFAIAAFHYVSTRPEMTAYFFPEGLGGAAAHADQAMPLLLGKIVPSGLLGILVAGLMAAFMSTHDSYFLCWSSVITRDVIGPLRTRPLSEKSQIRLTRVLILLIGAFLLWWGIWYELPKSVWTYMAVTGTVYLSGAGAILIGGLYWRRASSTGAMAALAGGLVSVVALDPVRALFPEPWQPWLKGSWVGLGTYVACAAVFVVFSLLFPDKRAAPPEPQEA